MSSMLTPEVVEAIARNAGAVKAAISSGDENAVLGTPCHSDECCSPKLIKFKFVLCDVDIKNINAVAAEDNHHKRPC